jgi:hypothetical protein
LRVTLSPDFLNNGLEFHRATAAHGPHGFGRNSISKAFDHCKIADLTKLHPARDKGFEGGATTAHIVFANALTIVNDYLAEFPLRSGQFLGLAD